MLFFLWSISTICSTLLSIQIEIVEYFTFFKIICFEFNSILDRSFSFSLQSQNGNNFLQYIEHFFLIFWSFTYIFLFCNFGENVTSKFLAIDHAINECDWYLFPYDVQRMLPTIMMSTQKPLILCGFANVVCTREAFKRVRVTLECFSEKCRQIILIYNKRI